MDTVSQHPLYSHESAAYIFGAIMRQPSIIYNGQDKYILTVDDFNANRVHKIIFGALYNLSYKDAQQITPQQFDLFLSSYTTQYDVYEENQGFDIVASAYDLVFDVDMALFDIHYTRIKKFSTLRELKAKGIDISEFYENNFLTREQDENKFNELTAEEIITRVRDRIQIVENKNTSRYIDAGQSAAVGVKELLEQLKVEPEVGISMEGAIINYATRGCRKGKMYMYSAPSGNGKTRTMVGNACAIAYPFIENGKIKRRPELEPILFIATEMREDEIQTLILAWISGVNEEKILTNTMTEDEEKLVSIAANIMEKYQNNFIIVCVPNPTIGGLRSIIVNYILEHNIGYVFYDYIFNSPGLMDEFKGTNLREDVVLMMLSNTLKEIAAEYNVFLMTATQLNGQWEAKSIRNANMIRGSKAIADKIDVGMIGVRAQQEEIDQVKLYCEQVGLRLPNMVVDIYKNRRGKLCDVKVFRYFDYGTCRTKDLLVTENASYKVLDNIVEFRYDYDFEELTDYE